MIHNQYDCKIKIIRTNNGAEFLSIDCQAFISSLGIVHQKTCVLPVLTRMKIFGCLCFYTVISPNHDKFDIRGHKAIFLGYPPCQKGYKLYDLNSHKILVSRDVVFHENVFTYAQSVPTSVVANLIPINPSDSLVPLFDDIPITNSSPVVDHSQNINSQQPQSILPSNQDD
ncbi:hypothetical protein LIER_16816 [Lithospermum erythrorhizon]|uniref:Retroviral polymerase SH3-like domain-containing protein n=1 Tax=Lithospermum erythrorhizon TaxID=34254 RepID=A0AAV3QDH1_LITER